jgi:tetratricopeptide (TPR) repeat protein
MLAGAAFLTSTSCTPEGPTVAPEAVVVAPVAHDEGPLLDRGAPVTLTAADGTALTLRSLRVRAVVDEPLAFTELEMVFDNPERRVLDGQLGVTMPPGARITRFARAAGPNWIEAEVVPRRAPYQNLMRGEPRQDAAMLAGAAGERFVARVDGITALEPTRVVVAYVQELRGRSEPYRVALAGLPRLPELSLSLSSRTPVSLGGEPALLKATTQGQVNRYTDITPSRDLTLHFSGPRELGLRRDEMVVARISPVPHDHPDPLDSLTVLFDTSASQSGGFEVQLQRLAQVLAAIDRHVAADIPLRVVAFDQGAEVVFEGRLSQFGRGSLDALRERGALGASNLAGALRAVASRGERRYQRLLLITDGMVTAGAPGVEVVRAEASRLLDAGYVRVDAMVEGGLHDSAVLGALAAVSPDHPGLVLHAALSPDATAQRLIRGVVADVEVAVKGGAWVYPQRFAALQAGDDVLVYAGLERSDSGEDFAVQLSGEIDREFAVPLVQTASPLLQDAWSGARASWLIDQANAQCATTQGGLPGERVVCEGWRRQALEWSAEHRVINDLTAMVVLPTAGDYERFGLDRSRPRNVLAVGPDGLEWRLSAAPDPAASGPATAGEPYALRPDLRGPLAWDDPPPEAPLSTAAVRRDSHSRHAARRDRQAESAKRPGREDMSLKPGREADVPDKDAGVARLGPRRSPEDAYEGNFLTVMNLLADWDAKQNALDVASRWHKARPAEVMALVALGEALEANGRPEQAARAYGSIVDLYPARADMRRLAAARLERLGEPYTWLVIDSYGRAIEQRHEDPAGYRLFAFALLRAGYFKEAFESLVDGLAWARSEPKTRPLEPVLLADLGLVAAAWIRRWPEQEGYVREALRVHEAELATKPSLRFVLSWDSELADLDLHVRDGLGWHAFYRNKSLASGGRLSDDMDAGYGLEAFTIDGDAGAFPYSVEVGYYARGATQGAGKLEIIEHDGQGQLFFDERPFVVLKQRAYVDLGTLSALPSIAATPR